MKHTELVQIIREEVERAVAERSLTKKEKGSKEKFVKKLKSSIPDFKDRYGENWKSVMYAVATKQAKSIGLF